LIFRELHFRTNKSPPRSCQLNLKYFFLASAGAALQRAAYEHTELVTI
jgi:hypothetical protein